MDDKEIAHMRRHHSSPQSLWHNQSGIASIMVSLVMIAVMTLIVLGFAEIARRDQRQTLDRQLSNQAFYAAETGVNDYAQKIKTYLTSHTTLTAADVANLNQTNCSPIAGNPIYTAMPSSTLNSPGGNVKYTCVLVTADPTSLQYSNVGGTSQIIPLNSVAPIGSVTLSWGATATTANATSSCPSNTGISLNVFPAESSWQCKLGVVRVDLVPTTGPFTLQTLQANTMTAFLVPTNPGNTGAGSVAYASSGSNQYASNANQGALVGGKCNASTCSVTVTGLSGTSYYMRVSSIYVPASVTVQGFTATTGTGTPLPLTGAQVVIDSTGLAQDILRRIQVRVPVNTSAGNDTFDAAIQSSQTLCKEFKTAPTNTGNDYYTSPVANCL